MKSSFSCSSQIAVARLPVEADMRVLVVEDSKRMATLLKRGLEEEGYAVDASGSGEEAIDYARAAAYDAIVLDVMLPGVDGFEVCRQIREGGIRTPVLMLTARDSVQDRVTGLDAGADDYLTKPFSLQELFARIRALIRRGPTERPPVLTVGDLSLDPARHLVRRADTPVKLTAKEFALLEYFMHNAGQVLSRGQLIEHAWDFAYEGDSNVLDVYVRYLREKIDRPFGRNSIETVRGVGYRLRDDQAAHAAD
jgi:two-component system, OmpR family, response regulator